MQSTHYPIEEMLDVFVDEPSRWACLKMLCVESERFGNAYGSRNNHQAWPGGYLDHVEEAMNVGILLYEQFNAIRPLLFSLSDLLLVLFLHDLEKPWKYDVGSDGKLYCKSEMVDKKYQHQFRMTRIKDYGIQLTDEQENAIRYAEGEHADYSGQQRGMGPLAAMAHMCDVASARLWPDHPLKKNDPWLGAKRHKGK